jgi:FMN reductase
MQIAIVLGQASPPGRLSRAAAMLAAEIRKVRSEIAIATIDLSAVALEPCDGRRLESYTEQTRDAVDAVVRSCAVVLCSPVYRASFSGVLKNVLDLLPVDALRDKAVAIVAMGASDHHFLAVDSQLRCVLSWFGALPLPTSLYLTSADFTNEGQPSADASDAIRGLGGSLVDLADRIHGAAFAPAPLAARANRPRN